MVMVAITLFPGGRVQLGSRCTCQDPRCRRAGLCHGPGSVLVDPGRVRRAVVSPSSPAGPTVSGLLVHGAPQLLRSYDVPQCSHDGPLSFAHVVARRQLRPRSPGRNGFADGPSPLASPQERSGFLLAPGVPSLTTLGFSVHDRLVSDRRRVDPFPWRRRHGAFRPKALRLVTVIRIVGNCTAAGVALSGDEGAALNPQDAAADHTRLETRVHF